MSAAKKTGNTVVWILIGLLIVGLGGFGATNFGGNIDNIGKVGDTPIRLNDYATELQTEIRNAERQLGTQINMQQAQLLGLVNSARSRVVSRTALDNEVARLGVSAGDALVAEEVRNLPNFRGTDGRFDRESYRFVLEQNGLTESEFEDNIRRQTARNILEGAVLTGIGAPQDYIDLIVEYAGSRRSYAVITLRPDDLDDPVGEPDDAALEAYYQANAPLFTLPEQRQISFAWLTPDMLLDSVAIDADAVRALYDERIGEYQVPERRLVERLVYPSQDEAQAARARIDGGDVDFDTLVADRGLELSDIDLGDVAIGDLGTAGDAVFALDEPGIVGPVDTDLGPALFRMNAILEAQNTTFEDVEDELKAELAQDAASRAISDMITDIDDRLAAGATLEDLAKETDMEFGQIDFFDGQDAGIAAYEAFRAAALAVNEGDFPEVAELDDGGIFALRLDGITPPALQPLADVRDDAVAGWQAQETQTRLLAKGEELKARLDDGAMIETLGLTSQHARALTRNGISPAPLSQAVFATEVGEAAVVDAGNEVLVVRVDAALPPDANDPALTLLRQGFQAQTNDAIARDLYAQFAQALVNQAGLTLDQAAINAVHAQFP